MNLPELVESMNFEQVRKLWDEQNPRPEFMYCEHQRYIVVKAHDSIGRPFYKRRCADCFGGMNHRYKIKEALELLNGEEPYDEEECNRLRQEMSNQVSTVYRTVRSAYDKKRRDLFWQYHKAYMHSTRWHLLRATVLTQSNYECASCKSKHVLQLHHRHYQTLGCESVDDVIVLCKQCHEMLHVAKDVLRSEMFVVGR
jgi:5-methylcytosine-specific restriction endonuclease McrA